MTEVKVTVELLNAVMSYLGTRPYQEVFMLVTEIQKQAVPQIKPEPAPEVVAE